MNVSCCHFFLMLSLNYFHSKQHTYIFRCLMWSVFNKSVYIKVLSGTSDLINWQKKIKLPSFVLKGQKFFLTLKEEVQKLKSLLKNSFIRKKFICKELKTNKNKTKQNYQVLTIRPKQNFSFNIISWTSLLLKGNLLYYSLFSVIYTFFSSLGFLT